MTRVLKPILLAVLLLLTQVGNVSAQRGNAPDQTQLVQTLIARIDQLEKRVAEFEAHKLAAGQNPGYDRFAEARYLVGDAERLI